MGEDKPSGRPGPGAPGCSAGGLDALFRPCSVAVLGASPRRESIGGTVLRNLVTGEYQGKVFPVNPAHEVVMSMKCYRSVLEIPDPVDLAVVIVRKDLALDVIRECGEKGVGALVIVSAGFGETGTPEGREREARLRELLGRYHMRASGPNCMGVINTEEAVRLNASFARVGPPPGPIAFVTQSGALGESMLQLAAERGAGISMFCSIGNRVDVDATDLVTYWDRDERTGVIAMYVESFLDPRQFIPVARRVTRRKPIVAVKAGRTAQGARAALSHTGSLVGRDVSYDALFEECGIVRVTSVGELFDVAAALAQQPAAPGPKVAVLTNAGGPGILATDALVGLGVTMATFTPETTALLRGALHSEASVNNPVDLLASATARDYDAAVRAALRDPGVDILLAIFAPPIMVDADPVTRVIAEAWRQEGRGKPVVACFMAKSSSVRAGLRQLQEAGIPTYPVPEEAAKAVAALVAHGSGRTRPEDPPTTIRPTGDGGAASIQAARQRAAEEHREPWLSLEQALALVGAYGIPTVATLFPDSLEGALDAAAQLGWPVVAKVDSPAILHRSDVGGVAAGIADEGQLVRAWRRLTDLLREHGGGRVALQKQLAGTRETVLGMTLDAMFGPLIMFGSGGIYVEVIRDVTFRLHPVGPRRAEEMIRQVRAFPLLAGTRGEPPVDLELLRDILVRLSALVGDHPEIVELELNPFLVAPAGRESGAVDVRVRLG
ncbi:MAG: acetate--CoA ligase family protein [Deltaproteobacteria bacterium]|nr:acetate--CoA ligase family protein [Deltaproteobacteria bacterium]